MQTLNIKQKFFAFGREFSFYDDNQMGVYWSKGSVFAIPRRCCLYDYNNRTTPLLQVRRKMFRWAPAFDVFDENGQAIFTVEKSWRFTTLQKVDIRVSSPKGVIVIESEGWINFSFKGFLGQNQIISLERHLALTSAYSAVIDTSAIPLHHAAALILAIECAVHSGKS